MTHHISTNHKKKVSLVFYVYAYCLGNCCGLIAVILAFTEVSSLNTRVMLIFALTINVFTFFAHAALSRRPQTRKVVLTKIVTVVLGLTTSSVLAGLAAYFHSDSYSMLFVCSVVFSLLYVMALVGYLVSVRLHWADCPPLNQAGATRRSGQTNTFFIPSSTILHQVYPMSRCTETTIRPGLGNTVNSLPFSTSIHSAGVLNTGVHNTGMRSTGVHNTGMRSTGVHNTGVRSTGMRSTGVMVQPDNDLPSYEQLDLTEPPKYSDVTTDMTVRTLTGSVRTVEESSDTELPPKYEDVIRVSDKNETHNSNNTSVISSRH